MLSLITTKQDANQTRRTSIFERSFTDCKRARKAERNAVWRSGFFVFKASRDGVFS